eukprot:4695819-Alexandrium_andersonii.AAC.1
MKKHCFARSMWSIMHTRLAIRFASETDGTSCRPRGLARDLPDVDRFRNTHVEHTGASMQKHPSRSLSNAWIELANPIPPSMS